MVDDELHSMRSAWEHEAAAADAMAAYHAIEGGLALSPEYGDMVAELIGDGWEAVEALEFCMELWGEYDSPEALAASDEEYAEWLAENDEDET
jgi:hypothetical protein